MSSYSECVHRGAKLLDDYKVTWYQDVDVDNLDMNLPWMLNGQGDVLAQVFSEEQDTVDRGGYWIGLGVLGLDARADSIRYGFDVGNAYAKGRLPDHVREAYDVLADAWKREIELRYKEAGLV